jgi:hypothetical protein
MGSLSRSSGLKSCSRPIAAPPPLCPSNLRRRVDGVRCAKAGRALSHLICSSAAEDSRSLPLRYGNRQSLKTDARGKESRNSNEKYIIREVQYIAHSESYSIHMMAMSFAGNVRDVLEPTFAREKKQPAMPDDDGSAGLCRHGEPMVISRCRRKMARRCLLLVSRFQDLRCAFVAARPRSKLVKLPIS